MFCAASHYAWFLSSLKQHATTCFPSYFQPWQIFLNNKRKLFTHITEVHSTNLFLVYNPQHSATLPGTIFRVTVCEYVKHTHLGSSEIAFTLLGNFKMLFSTENTIQRESDTLTAAFREGNVYR